MHPDTDIAVPLTQTLSTTHAHPSKGALEERVMFFVGGITAAIVVGFAVYRAYTGDVRGAVINTLIVLTVLSAMALGRTERFRGMALNLFGATISAGCLVSALMVSSNGLLWALLVLVINALTLRQAWAIGLNLAIILTLSWASHLYESPIHQVSWATVALLLSSFALMMMDQLREQRQKLVLQANLDPLTGAGNRRLMRDHLQELVAERRSGLNSGTLLVLDLDKFKLINDRHGHETGDRVLIEFARSVARSMRAEDGLYRMGGEEFVLLLRGMDAATARAYLPGLHERLSGTVNTPDGVVNFSAGAAVLREGEDWSQWLARADQALYVAKTDGRDRLHFSDAE